jgi:hypothetical protein
MAYDRLLNRDQQPDQDQVRKTIGSEVLPVWDQVRAFLAKTYPDFEPEWVFFNPKEGWGLRYRRESQQLCMLFPERGAFMAFLTLSPEDDQEALERINYFNARIRALLNRPSNLPQGRWLWLRLEDHTDFFGLRILLEIKSS